MNSNYFFDAVDLRLKSKYFNNNKKKEKTKKKTQKEIGIIFCSKIRKQK